MKIRLLIGPVLAISFSCSSLSSKSPAAVSPPGEQKAETSILLRVSGSDSELVLEILKLTAMYSGLQPLPRDPAAAFLSGGEKLQLMKPSKYLFAEISGETRYSGMMEDGNGPKPIQGTPLPAVEKLISSFSSEKSGMTAEEFQTLQSMSGNAKKISQLGSMCGLKSRAAILACRLHLERTYSDTKVKEILKTAGNTDEIAKRYLIAALVETASFAYKSNRKTSAALLATAKEAGTAFSPSVAVSADLLDYMLHPEKEYRGTGATAPYWQTLIQLQKTTKNQAGNETAATDGTFFKTLTYLYSGVNQYNRGKFTEAEKDFTAGLTEMRKTNLTNSEWFFLALGVQGLTMAQNGRAKNAAELMFAGRDALEMLKGEKTASYGFITWVYAIALAKSDEVRKSIVFFQAASRLLKQNGYSAAAQAAASKSLSPVLEYYWELYSPPEITSLGFSDMEDSLMKSYSGGFNIKKHSAAIRARTYGGRLADTNILLHAMLQPEKDTSKPAEGLRQAFRSAAMNRSGKGLFFIDIGPAVANITDPAITSQALAREFRAMPVVALDLPGEVDLYKKRVLRSAKKRLLSHKNIYIFSGDGLKSLKEQFALADSWILKDRGMPDYSDKDVIVIRAANSIDIYVPWSMAKPCIQQMALDFKNKKVLLLFNRSILWKAENSDYFKVIGILSVRGFHHNQRSLDRKGQSPYTLNSAFFP